jgi:hypothetical protein
LPIGGKAATLVVAGAVGTLVGVGTIVVAGGTVVLAIRLIVGTEVLATTAVVGAALGTTVAVVGMVVAVGTAVGSAPQPTNSPATSSPVRARANNLFNLFKNLLYKIKLLLPRRYHLNM